MKSKIESKGPPQENGEQEDVKLLADVQAFAAELGFAGGSLGEGDFNDFAPTNAAKSISKKPSKQQENSKANNRITPAPHKSKPAYNKTHKSEKLREERQFGSTDPRARSILPRDEPAIWWEAASNLPKVPLKRVEAPPHIIESARKAAESLLRNEEAAFENRASNGQDLKWLQQARRSGTTADKVAALTVLIQESTVANLKALDQLVTLANKRIGTRSIVGSAMDALRELFVSILLPSDRKLRFFEQQPLEAVQRRPAKEKDRYLLYWIVEDGIKKRFAIFLDAVEAASKDSLEFLKDRSVKTLYDLLSERPEGEARLLSALVNKLGDPDRKLASKAGYLVSKLLNQHPGMKEIVVREIEKFVFRPGLSDRARYYSVIYLNQMVLTHKDGTLARKLVGLYFSFFSLILDGKLGTAATLSKASHEKELAKKALKRSKKKNKANAASKRYEEEKEDAPPGVHSGELDARMLSALITGVRRAFPFLSSEEIEPLIETHSDSLFRLIHTRSFGVATQALMLLFQVMSAKTSITDRYYRALYAALASPELPKSTKAPMFLSLLVKAIKADVTAKRTSAFVKRILQVAIESNANLACGCLIIVSELLKARPGSWNSILQAEEKDDEEVERFQDDDDDDDNDDTDANGNDANGGGGLNGGFQGAKIAKGDMLKGAEGGALWPTASTGYDSRKRDPQYSNAERSALWELTCLACHVHPSVAAMARTLLVGANIVYDGDPLKDLTLSAFLDKFVQRKPKSVRGDSLMQPLVVVSSARGETSHRDSLAHLAVQDVRPDEVFFHKFYNLGGIMNDTRKKKRKSKGEEDEEDVLLSDAADSDEDDESDAVDDFLAGEEEGGDEGIGADPDRARTYDYGQLAAAMGSDDDDDSFEDDAILSDEEDSEIDGSASAQEEQNDDDDAVGALGSSSSGGDSDDDDSEDSFSLEGEEFSDITDEDEDDDEEDDEIADREAYVLLRKLAAKNNVDDEVGSDVDPFDLSEPSSDEEKASSKKRKKSSSQSVFAPAIDYEEMIERGAREDYEAEKEQEEEEEQEEEGEGEEEDFERPAKKKGKIQRSK